MTDINTLISQNLELEGLLKILLERDSVHARALLAQKIETYSAAVHQFLAEREQNTPAQEVKAGQLVAEGSTIAEQAQTVEVKDEEAVSDEVDPEMDAAAEAIERGEQHAAAETTARTSESLLQAFTINDKFRFRRELFNGDEEDFDETLQLLAHMPDFEEARDYLEHDLLWDPKNDDVQAFLEIVKAHLPA